jgi:formylglycine-generating enzyme required for sulfatase activity
LRYAREIALEKPEGAIFIIPLRLDECDVPRGLRFYQWVDYFGGKKKEGYDALVQSLKLRYEQKTGSKYSEPIQEEVSKESEPAKKVERKRTQDLTPYNETQEHGTTEKIENAVKSVSQKRKPQDRGKTKREKEKVGEVSRKLLPDKAVEKDSQKSVVQKPTFGKSYWLLSLPIVIIAAILIKGWIGGPGEGDPPQYSTPTATETISVRYTDTAQPSATRPSPSHTPKVTATEARNDQLLVSATEVFSNTADQLVTLPEFWIDRTPVTNAQFTEFVNSTGYVTEPELSKTGLSCMNAVCTMISGDSWKSHTAVSSNPVVQVSWNDANSYCEWAGKDLVTDAEFRAGLGLDGLIGASDYEGVDGEWLFDKTSNLHRAVKMDMPENRSSSNLTFRCVTR